MSKYNLIAVAIAATLAAPAALADTILVGPGPTSTPTVLPQNAFIDATVNAVASNNLTIAADAGSVYLGRTTGYNVRVTLSQGKFNGNPNVANVGQAVPTPAALAGGGNDSNIATFAVTPAAAGVKSGDGIVVSNIIVDGVAALSAGGKIDVEVKLFDPVGGGQLGETLSATLVETIQGWVVKFTPGAATQRIDVGATSKKTMFGTAVVGSGTLGTLFNAGSVNVSTDTDLTSVMTLNLATATAPLAVNGTNFAPFKPVTGGNGGSVYLTSDAACGTAAPAVVIPLTVSASGDSASIPATTTAAAVNASPNLCFDANGKTAILAQAISGTVTVSQTNTIAAPAASGNFRAMSYNGSVVTVDNFNPANNLDQLSFLRVTNGSTTDGLVSIAGTCDDGTATTGTATFILGGGMTKTVTAPNLAAGTGMTTGMGTCAAGGKQSLVITGEFSGLKVQGFTKSRLSAGEVTTNVNNSN